MTAPPHTGFHFFSICNRGVLDGQDDVPHQARHALTGLAQSNGPRPNDRGDAGLVATDSKKPCEKFIELVISFLLLLQLSPWC